MAFEQNITAAWHWFLGEDKDLEFVIYQEDGVTVQDITGWALEWVLRVEDDDTGAAVISKTTSSGIALTTPTSGVATVTIADTDTADLTVGTYRHALKRTDDGAETILAWGDCVLRQAVCH